MKERINLDEKQKEIIYCVTVVLVIIFLAFGDQIALRFIKANPNPNDRIFGGGTQSIYQIDFLEELSMEGVLQKLENNETFLLLSSKDDCYTCEKYLPVIEEEKKSLSIPLYYINRNLYDNSMMSMQKFMQISNSLEKNITYTPYLMYFKDGQLEDDLIGKKEQSELKDFMIKNQIILE